MPVRHNRTARDQRDAHRPPRVRRLERRIVLNATAELAALGDLFINGDAADDLIRVDTNSDGRIEIFDANNAVVPIRVGIDGFGNPILVDSVAPDQIASGRLKVNLGGGDDSLEVDLPAGLDLAVIDGDGNDSVNVTLRSDAGDIRDQTLELHAETIHLDADGNSLDLGLSRLVSTSSGGSIDIQNATDLRLGAIDVEANLTLGSTLSPIAGSITQADATPIDVFSIEAYNAGDLTLKDPRNEIDEVLTIVSTGDVKVSSSGSTNIQFARGENLAFTSLGDDADLIVDDIQVNTPENGDVKLTAGDDITSVDAGTGSAIIADDLYLLANNATDDDKTVINLRTDVNDLDATVQGDNPGDLIIHEIGSIRLASSGAGPDFGVIRTGNGIIQINAGDSIMIDDGDASNDGASLTVDREIEAGGVNGGIQLFATNDLVVGDLVQLASQSIQDGAVSITAERVVLGDDFEINTGDGIGIARRFAPRPDPDGLQATDHDFVDVETAFYNVHSVTTDTLTQFNENDAIGTLSLDIGVEGENGLKLFIDWGGDSERLTEETDLQGGTRVDVQHVYTQNDILDSKLNGRTSATDPLAVRFSVSHHPSISITGESIEQTVPDDTIGRVSESVKSGLISSTDDPNTPQTSNPGYENGRAFFVIPRIDVPVAFFPVRDVIPEAIDPPPAILVSSVTLMSDVRLDTIEASASSITIREEYFQLRALSPDPEGEDLIEPARLPEGILAGDRLNDLFAQLPDGSYEIQYVIGDGDQRTILRVELRGGEPIIISDELEGGELRLRRLDAEADETIRTENNEGNNEDEDKSSEREQPVRPVQEKAQNQTSQNEPGNEWNGVDLATSAIAFTSIAQRPFSLGNRFLRKCQDAPPNRPSLDRNATMLPVADPIEP